MIKTSPLLSWVFSFLTSGIYSIYWLYNRSELINELNQANILNGKKMLTRILVAYIFAFFLLFIVPYLIPNREGSIIHSLELFRIVQVALLVSFIVFLRLVIKSFYKVGYAIQRIQSKLNSNKKCSPHLSWLLFFVFYLNVPYLQSHLNNVIDNKNA